MNTAGRYARVEDWLRRLKMPAALANLEDVMKRAAEKSSSPVEVLDTLLEREVIDRFERRLKANLKLSGLPSHQLLEEFDFEAQPTVPRPVVEQLSTMRFLADGENVILLGPCGVGKTHLAIGLAMRAIQEGYRVYFRTLHDLVTRARRSRMRGSTTDFLAVTQRADLFVLDELGFQSLDNEDATFLFELVNKRYQAKKSMIVTSNKSFGQWGEVFPDPVMAVAILDRLLHHATTINIKGDSYRLKNRKDAGLPDIHTEAKEA